MNKPSVYIETSVVSYLTSKPSGLLVVAANQQITREWWEKALPRFDAYVSPAVLEEIAGGDPDAAQRRLDRVGPFALLATNDEIEGMADLYFEELNLPDKARGDALHMAIASWHAVDFMVSWNCRHIVNGKMLRTLRDINKRLGVYTPVVCTPQQLMEA